MAFLLEEVPAIARLIGAIIMLLWPSDPEKRELVNTLTVLFALFGILRVSAARRSAGRQSGRSMRNTQRPCDRYTMLGRRR